MGLLGLQLLGLAQVLQLLATYLLDLMRLLNHALLLLYLHQLSLLNQLLVQMASLFYLPSLVVILRLQVLCVYRTVIPLNPNPARLEGHALMVIFNEILAFLNSCQNYLMEH